MNPRTIAGICAVLSILAVPSIEAQEEEKTTRVLEDRFIVSLRAVVSTLSTDVASGRSLGLLINLEDVLGIDDSHRTAAISGFYRFGNRRKHALGFSFANYDRDGSAVATATVPIFDVEFLGGIEAEFRNRALTLDYRFSFVNNGKTEAGFTAGLSIYEFDLKIRGFVAVAGDPDNLVFQPKRTDVVAPAPTIGFFIHYAILRNLILELRASFLNLDLSNASGQITNSSVDFSWFFSRHVGLVVGLINSNINYQREKRGERLNIGYGQTGVTAGLSIAF